MKFRTGFLLLLAVSVIQSAQSQNTVIGTPGQTIGASTAITTAVPFLTITPDSRHAGMGDAGVATTPDANAAYWNAGKLVFIDKTYGGSLSYTPWLGNLINDMWIGSLSGFYKISREQVVSASLKYFDLGDIEFRNQANFSEGTFNPREAAFDVTYSRKLSEKLGVGLTGRYIYSNLTGAYTGSDAQAGNSVATDIGVFYTTPINNSNSTLNLGAQISNIGAKLSYTDNANRDFLPTNLRFGSGFTTQLDPFNTLTFVLDFNKLMVPSVYDSDKSLLSGMFGSFTDAPGGGSEELREIMTSLGMEYWYNQTFSGRLGYFLEASDKGNRKYLTAGLGFRKEKFGFDMAYIVPTNQRNHPLAETIRFTLLLQIPETVLDREETVTDQ